MHRLYVQGEVKPTGTNNVNKSVKKNDMFNYLLNVMQSSEVHNVKFICDSLLLSCPGPVCYIPIGTQETRFCEIFG